MLPTSFTFFFTLFVYLLSLSLPSLSLSLSLCRFCSVRQPRNSIGSLTDQLRKQTLPSKPCFGRQPGARSLAPLHLQDPSSSDLFFGFRALRHCHCAEGPTPRAYVVLLIQLVRARSSRHPSCASSLVTVVSVMHRWPAFEVRFLGGRAGILLLAASQEHACCPFQTCKISAKKNELEPVCLGEEGPLRNLDTRSHKWLRVKTMYPKWNSGKWKHGLKPAVPW